MSHFGTPELPFLLADIGVPVAWGAITGLALLDVVDREEISGQNITITGRERVVTIEAGAFEGLGEGETITVDGADYRVLQAHQSGDGAVLSVLVIPI